MRHPGIRRYTCPHAPCVRRPPQAKALCCTCSTLVGLPRPPWTHHGKRMRVALCACSASWKCSTCQARASRDCRRFRGMASLCRGEPTAWFGRNPSRRTLEARTGGGSTRSNAAWSTASSFAGAVHWGALCPRRRYTCWRTWRARKSAELTS